MYTMEEFRDDVSTVVAYIWTEKVRDYKECLRNENGAEGHIFLTLKRLADFVDGEGEPEFCYECGADIPLDAASVGGGWHEPWCSCYGRLERTVVLALPRRRQQPTRTSIDSKTGPGRTNAKTARISNADGGRPAPQLPGRPHDK